MLRDPVPVLRQEEGLQALGLHLRGGRVLHVQEDHVLGAVLLAHVGVVRQVVGRRAHGARVPGLHQHVHHGGHRRRHLGALPLGVPGHLRFEVEGVLAQLSDLLGVRHDADVRLEAADDAAGILVGLHEAVDVVHH